MSTTPTQPPEPTEQDREATEAVLYETRVHGQPVAYSIPWPQITGLGNAIAQAIATARIRAHAEGRREGLREAIAVIDQRLCDATRNAILMSEFDKWKIRQAESIATRDAIAARAAGTGEG